VYSRPVTNKLLNGVIELINSHGGNVEMLSSSQIEVRYGKNLANLKGFVAKDGASIVNADAFSLDTPMHETGHIWIKALKFSNRELYNALIEQSLDHPATDQILQLYPELQGENQREALGEEVFSMLFGLNAQDKAMSRVDAGVFTRMKDTFAEFISWLKNWINRNLGINFSFNDNLQNVMDKVAGTMLTSSYFNFGIGDMMIMQNMGINIPAETTELIEVKRKLNEQGLIVKTC